MVIIPCFQKVLHRTLKKMGGVQMFRSGCQKEIVTLDLINNPLRTTKTLSGYPESLPAWVVKRCQNGHRQSRPGATSLTRPADSHPRFLKLLTRFHKKINLQKSSKDFDVQNPEKIINNGATMHYHTRPQIPNELAAFSFKSS